MNKADPHNMYYVAILCPSPVNEKILGYKQWMKNRFGCRVAMKSPAHITLIAPFWFAHERENELMRTIQSFGNIVPTQKIELDGFSHFRKRVLFVQVKENPSLGDLKDRVEHHFRESIGNSIEKDDRPFHPHITIANRDMKPSDFEEAWEHFSKKEFRESFEVNSICLLKLDLARWNVIGESSGSSPN